MWNIIGCVSNLSWGDIVQDRDCTTDKKKWFFTDRIDTYIEYESY